MGKRKCAWCPNYFNSTTAAGRFCSKKCISDWRAHRAHMDSINTHPPISSPKMVSPMPQLLLNKYSFKKERYKEPPNTANCKVCNKKWEFLLEYTKKFDYQLSFFLHANTKKWNQLSKDKKHELISFLFLIEAPWDELSLTKKKELIKKGGSKSLLDLLQRRHSLGGGDDVSLFLIQILDNYASGQTIKGRADLCYFNFDKNELKTLFPNADGQLPTNELKKKFPQYIYTSTKKKDSLSDFGKRLKRVLGDPEKTLLERSVNFCYYYSEVSGGILGGENVVHGCICNKCIPEYINNNKDLHPCWELEEEKEEAKKQKRAEKEEKAIKEEKRKREEDNKMKEEKREDERLRIKAKKLGVTVDEVRKKESASLGMQGCLGFIVFIVIVYFLFAWWFGFHLF